MRSKGISSNENAREFKFSVLKIPIQFLHISQRNEKLLLFCGFTTFTTFLNAEVILSSLLNISGDNSKSDHFCVNLHNITDFDVDFWQLSSRTGYMSQKTSYCFTGSTIWADISVSLRTFRPRSYPTSVDEGTTVVIISGTTFVISKVVSSILPEIRHDD